MKKIIGVLSILAIVVTGCNTQGQYVQIIADSPDSVWQICTATIEYYGYLPLIEDNKSGCWQSQWQNFLLPLRRGGYRTAVWLKISAVGPSNKTERELYRIYLRVIRQINIATHDFMNPRCAIWIADGYDLRTQTLLLNAIEGKSALYRRKRE